MQLRKMKYSMMVLFLFVIMSLAAGQFGVTFMTPDTFAWYRTLARPTWTPPDYVFPVVWTVAYLMIAISAWLVWGEKKENYGWALSAWFLQLILNGLWTPLFFGYHQIRWSFVLIIFYAAMALLTTVLFYKHHKFAGVLMTLYLGWIMFAVALNYAFWQLN